MKKEQKLIKIPQVAAFDPYLDVLGGGERHILSILKIFETQGFQVSIFWDDDLSEKIEKQFHLSFKDLHFVSNIFKKAPAFERLNELQKYDYFFYVTDGSYFVSSAKKTFIFCMVPDKKLYNMNLLNKIKTINARFISNSLFTKKWLDSWNVHNDTVLPFVSSDFFDQEKSSILKKNTILSVGRFFPQLHSKRQDIVINWFVNLKKSHPEFQNFDLVLAGALKEEDSEYLKKLESQCDGDKSIKFETNISFDRLLELYYSSKYYWHMAGFGVDESLFPEQTEHLGITPLEAMASGCLTFAYEAGGPKELIFDGKNGYLFDSQTELFSKMQNLEKNPAFQMDIIRTGKKFVSDYFSCEVFSKNVKDYFSI